MIFFTSDTLTVQLFPDWNIMIFKLMSLLCRAYFQIECCNENFQGCCDLEEYLEGWLTYYTKMANGGLQVGQQSHSYLIKISAVLAEINHIVHFAIPNIYILFLLYLHSFFVAQSTVYERIKYPSTTFSETFKV